MLSKEAQSIKWSPPVNIFLRNGTSTPNNLLALLSRLCRNTGNIVPVGPSVISTAGRNPCFDQREKSVLDPSHPFGMTTRSSAVTTQSVLEREDRGEGGARKFLPSPSLSRKPGVKSKR